MNDADHVQRSELSRAACLKLLREADFARVVSSIRCLPVVWPTRIALANETHLILTSNDEMISSLAERGDVLSIEIDDLGLDGATWSVMVSSIAAPAEQPPPSLVKPLEHGATLLSVPLNLVTGGQVT